jgi:glucosamine--fructose-6-phosphate aminotransferase (isomerizing)
VPRLEEILAQEEALAEVAKSLAAAESLCFVGRVRGFPVAREGAQKFKKISSRPSPSCRTTS